MVPRYIHLARRAARGSLIAFWGVLLAGCYSYKSPSEITEGDQLTAKTRVEHRGLPVDLRQLDLETAVDIALANNPTYAAAQHSMAAAYARFYQSLSAFSPTVSGNLSSTQYQYYAPLGGDSPWAPTYGAVLTGQWVVFNGFMDTMNAMAARSSAKQSASLNRDARRLLMQSVILTYNQVLLSISQMRIAEANETFQQQMVDDTQLKFDAGASPLSDLLNFKILKNNAANGVIIARLGYDTNRIVLASLMGMTAGEIPPATKFPDIDTEKATELSLSVEFYLDMALAQRPVLRSLGEALSASESYLYVTWGSFLPNVVLGMNYGFSRTDQLENYPVGSARPRSQDLLYNYGMNVNWLLFDGGARWAQVRQAQANLAISQEQLTDKWITVVTEVREAHVEFAANIADAKILGDTLVMTKKQRDLVRSEYDAGNTSVVRVNEVQRDLINAQLRFATALINIENSKAKLDTAVASR